MRFILFFFGFIRVKSKKMKICDVLTDYKPIQDCTRAPIVVSNHCSWADMFFYLAYNVSFLSKSAVSKAPLLGIHATARQSIYLNREDTNDRNRVLEYIKTRTERVAKYGDIAPLLIFPEGTITNGRVLMGFKKGAFFSGDPIKIYILKYNTEFQVITSLININPLYSFIINILQLWNEIEIYEYEDHFDPEYVYNKYNISKEDPDSWEKVAKEVKSLMIFLSGFRSSEDNFRDTLDFEKESLERDESVHDLM